MCKFESSQVSQAVTQLRIVLWKIPKVPAKCGLLQVYALFLYSKIQQSVSEIGESLWRILEIFPFCRDGAGDGRDHHCVVWDAVNQLL